jgi:hypothetical protein
MAGYRAFYVEDGNFRESVSFDCTSDDAAIEQARRLAESQEIELWSGARMVATLDHKPD